MTSKEQDDLIAKGICPVCAAPLEFREKCKQCPQCFWSACNA